MKQQEIVTLLRNFRRKFVAMASNEENSRGSDLGGWCAITAHAIMRNLNRKGFRPTFCCNWDHAFLYWRGYYLDITATQFGHHGQYPAVYVSKTPLQRYHQIRRKTRNPNKVWRNLCRGWMQPIHYTTHEITQLVETL